MSYSSDLKEELAKVIDNPRHCRLAELGAIICCNGKIFDDRLEVVTESDIVQNVCTELLYKAFGIEPEISEITDNRRKRAFVLTIKYSEETKDLFMALKMELSVDGVGAKLPDMDMLTTKNCCRRSFIRGAFLSVGSISNPDRSYHFELPCRDSAKAEAVADILKALSLDAKVVQRQRYHVVYLKEGSQIVDVLGLMGARRGLLEFENMRIVREVRGNVNRRVNCETANINKTAKASARQIEDIKYIRDNMGLESLPNGLDEMAKVRLQYPEATLGELGQKLEPPVGKSGVNHRLRKLSQIAETLKEQEDMK